MDSNELLQFLVAIVPFLSLWLTWLLYLIDDDDVVERMDARADNDEYSGLKFAGIILIILVVSFIWILSALD